MCENLQRNIFNDCSERRKKGGLTVEDSMTTIQTKLILEFLLPLCAVGILQITQYPLQP